MLLQENTPFDELFPPGADSVICRSAADTPIANGLPQQILDRYQALRCKIRDGLQKSNDLRAAYLLLGLTPPARPCQSHGKRSRRVSAARLSRLLRHAANDDATAREELRKLLQERSLIWSDVLGEFAGIEEQLIDLVSGDRLAQRLREMKARFALPKPNPLIQLAIANLLLCWLHLECIAVLESARHSSQARKWARWFAKAWFKVQEAALAYRDLGEKLL